MNKYNLLIKKIQSVLTPDLLIGKWKIQSSPLQGHCYVASESLYHLLNDNNWKPMCASYIENDSKSTHWWLENKITKERLDPTSEQFKGKNPPYDKGKGSGFLTKLPSKRAQIVIDRIKNL